MMNQEQKVIAHFYSLDVLRGIAALSVVFWHWQHFFFTGTEPGSFDVTRLPLYDWISILYTDGFLAVDLFFSLSGFIFYWLYATRIADGTLTRCKFALLRFSRLYPLHFLTLLIVAGLQFGVFNNTGSYFVYSFNDSKHFLLNLFFAAAWGLEEGYSFNGPIWSVSVEILLYIFFFICCRLFPIRASFLICFSVLGFIVVQTIYPHLGRGMGSFFLGGSIFLAYQAIVSSAYAAELTEWLCYLAIGIWLFTLMVNIIGIDTSRLSNDAFPFLWFNLSLKLIALKILLYWPSIVLFPLTILSLSLLETRRGTLGKRLAFLGNISYSAYLLHFPLQLAFYIGFTFFEINTSVYYSPWLLLLFFSCLIVICLASYRYFELPAQRAIRQLNAICGSKINAFKQA